MKERAPPVAQLGHNIGVGGRCFGRGAEVAGINFVLAAGGEDVLAQRILSHQPSGEERKRDARTGEVNQHVVRGAAVPSDWLRMFGELFRLGIDINHLDLINDPVAPGEEAATLNCSCVFHGAKAAACGNSE